MEELLMLYKSSNSALEKANIWSHIEEKIDELVIDYKQYGDTQYKYIVSDVELIDGLFDLCIELKEEGVI